LKSYNRMCWPKAQIIHQGKFSDANGLNSWGGAWFWFRFQKIFHPLELSTISKATSIPDKPEKTNNKLQTNHNNRNSKFEIRFGHWILGFNWYLVLANWLFAVKCTKYTNKELKASENRQHAVSKGKYRRDYAHGFCSTQVLKKHDCRTA